MGIWGRVPSGVQGQSPWSEIRGQSPPEAETLLAFECSLKVANLPTFEKIWNTKKSDTICVIFLNKKFELMLTRRAKNYSSLGSVV